MNNGFLQKFYDILNEAIKLDPARIDYLLSLDISGTKEKTKDISKIKFFELFDKEDCT